MQICEMAQGLRWPEDPIALMDGSVLVVEIEGGSLARAYPGGRVERLAAIDIGDQPEVSASGPVD
jgi:gluconolactonase